MEHHAQRAVRAIRGSQRRLPSDPPPRGGELEQGSSAGCPRLERDELAAALQGVLRSIERSARILRESASLFRARNDEAAAQQMEQRALDSASRAQRMRAALREVQLRPAP